MGKKLFFIFVGLFLFLANGVFGGTTYVRGVIGTNTVWTPAGSPYVVIGNLLVNTDVLLDIKPGVEVLFTENKYLMIKGRLRAMGTQSDSIIFTALDTARPWHGLHFKQEANPCSLKYCRISYACSSAIYNEDTIYIGYSTITNNRAYEDGGAIWNYRGTATIVNNTITNNWAGDDGGGISNWYGNITITNNRIIKNYAYYDGGGIHNNGTATITNNTITDNSAGDDGGGIWNYRTVTITNNTITNNSAGDDGGGIWNHHIATITNNRITNNYASHDGGGIYNDGRATINSNIITNNKAASGGGIWHHGEITIIYNTIIDSTPSTIFINYFSSFTLNYNDLNNLNPTGYTVYNNTPDTINARRNYWYTLDTNVINQKIYDFWDDFILGEVFYLPFLTQPIGIAEKEELLKKDLKTIYANLSNLPKEKGLKIYNILGKIVNPKNLKPGIYFLETKEKRKRKVIIK